MAWIVILAVIIGILGYYAYKGYKGHPVGMEGQEVVCTKCSNKFVLASAFPGRTLFGFLKLKCPKCAKKFCYPLTTSYRSFYWLVIIMSIGNMLYIIFNLKQIPILTPIGLLVIIALWKDHLLKKKIIAAQHCQTNNKSST